MIINGRGTSPLAVSIVITKGIAGIVAIQPNPQDSRCHPNGAIGQMPNITNPTIMIANDTKIIVSVIAERTSVAPNAAPNPQQMRKKPTCSAKIITSVKKLLLIHPFSQ